MQNINAIGVDLAKRVIQVHAVDGQGRKVFNKALKRACFLEFMATLSPTLVGMESCCGSQFWARRLREFGHNVRIMPPKLVKPYAREQKNDANDAAAVCEAVQRPQMRFVPIKEEWQQELQTFHRARSQLVASKVALECAIHGLCHEFGIVLSKTPTRFEWELEELTDGSRKGLGSLAREAILPLLEQWKLLNQKIKVMTQRLQQISRESEACRRLQTIPGVGPIVSTALVSRVADGSEFESGRQMAAWLGLVPKQRSSGGKTVLLGISKHGDRYLRTLLVHGARSVVIRANSENPSCHNLWIHDKKTRRGMNRATVALANKNARIAWALLRTGKEFEHRYRDLKTA